MTEAEKTSQSPSRHPASEKPANNFAQTEDKGRARKVKALIALSCVCIVVFAISLIGIIFVALVIAAMAELQEGATLPADPLNTAVQAFNVIGAVLLLVTGILGLRLPGKPKLDAPLSLIAGIAAVTVGVKLALTLALQPLDPLGESLISLAVIAVLVAVVLIARSFYGTEDDSFWTYYSRQAMLADPKRLGFLRAIEVLYAVCIVYTLTILMFTSRDNAVYTYQSIMAWVNVVFMGMALWFIIRRYRVARGFVIGYSCFNIACNVVYVLVTGGMSASELVLGTSFDLFMIGFFVFSQKARLVLVNPLDMGRSKAEGHAGTSIKDSLSFPIKRKGWPFIRNLIIYYCVFSLVGHWMEASFCMLIRMGLVAGEYDPTNTMLWRDWFFPFPMEGIAVVLVALLLYPLKNWLVRKIPVPVVPYIASFVINALFCGTIEFVAGFIVNADLALWNYSDMPFNIMGQVCLQNVIGFGVAASLITWLVYPLMERAIAGLSKDTMNVVFAVTVFAYAIPQALYIFDFSMFLPEGLTESAQTVDVTAVTEATEPVG